MRKIRAAVVGYGNIGQYVVAASAAPPDFEIAGIVRRSGAENKPAELEAYAVVKDIKELKDVDVAVLATPTRSVEKYAKEILAMGINTVDSFDIHTQITSLRRSLDESAKAGKAVAIISAGWDPGSDSVVRTLLEAIAPKGITYTNFGPGRSMGHSVAVRAIDGHHHNRYNAYCLADDVMEPYRPYVDELVFSLVKLYGANLELTKEIKSRLLVIPTLDVRINGKRSPLMVAVAQTTASLYKCFCGEIRRISYPER